MKALFGNKPSISITSLVLLVIALVLAACSGGYYNHTENEYNKEEALRLLHEFKNGTLVVKIPTSGNKLRLLKSLYENENDPEKKIERKAVYDGEFQNLQKVQTAFVRSIVDYYKFNNYIFLPDTLITNNDFEKEVAHVLNEKLQLTDFNQKLASPVLILTNRRAYSDLFITLINGKFPPDPFPYTPFGKTGNTTNFSAKSMFNPDDSTAIMKSVFLLNDRLISKYKSTHPY